MCYYINGTSNFYVRPIKGITTTVNLDEMKIVDYHDRMIVPIPNADGIDYRESEQNPIFDTGIRGMAILQPDGPSFTLNRHRVRYNDTQFPRSFHS